MNNCCEWAMPQKLPLGSFKWVEEIFQFNEDFIKTYNGDSNLVCFGEVDAQCPKELHELHNDSPFLPERVKIEKVENYIANLHDKKECHTHQKLEILKRGLVLKKKCIESL